MVSVQSSIHSAISIVNAIATGKGATLGISKKIDITIKELVDYIVDSLGYEGDVVWNTEKPDGQLKKLLSTERMNKIIDINPIALEDGINKTVEWYINNKEWADSRK